MALTYSIVDSTVFGNKRMITADITFDNSYVSGGMPVAPASLGLGSILFAHVGSKSGYMIQYDHVNKKLQVYYPGAVHTHTENTAATYTQNATTGPSTAAVGAEVANAANLSALSVRVMVVGQ